MFFFFLLRNVVFGFVLPTNSCFFCFVYIVGLGRSYSNTVTGAINDLLTVIIVVIIKTIFVTYVQVMNELGLGSCLFSFPL